MYKCNISKSKTSLVSRASAVSDVIERTTSPDRKSNESVEEKEEYKVGCTTKTERILSVFCNAIFIKAFVLTFVAEWGDRSQLSTVGLAVSTVSHHFCGFTREK